MSPQKTNPSNKAIEILDLKFGSVQKFKEDFNQAALTLFGSGWVWVVRNTDGNIEIQALEKSENPITSGQIPLLVCDVWEHAYYLDYQNDRAKYLTQFWQIMNWNFLEHNISASESERNRIVLRGTNEIHDGL